MLHLDASAQKKYIGEQEIDRGAVGGSGLAEESNSIKIHSTKKTELIEEERIRMSKRDNIINPALQKLHIRSPNGIFNLVILQKRFPVLILLYLKMKKRFPEPFSQIMHLIQDLLLLLCSLVHQVLYLVCSNTNWCCGVLFSN